MKKLLKVILILLGLVLILLVGLFFIPDETLSPDAAEWLESPVDPDPERNIYTGLLGLGAAGDKDFIQEGIRIGHEVNKLVIAHQKIWASGVEISEEAVSERVDQMFSLTKAELDITFKKEQLCIPSETQCISFWREKKDMIDGFVQNNQVLLSRVQHLKTLTHFVNTTIPDLVIPWPEYFVQVNLSRLITSHAASNLLDQHDHNSLQLIYDELAFSRFLLANANNLVEKMIAAALIRNAVYTLVQLADESVTRSEFFNILPLSFDEISLRRIFHYESRLNEKITQQISSGSSSIGSILGYDLMIPKLLLPRLFKNNHYMNRYILSVERIVRKSELTGQDFLAELNSMDEESMALGFIDYLKNPIGTILYNNFQSNYSYDGYVIRQYDLDGLITLFNLKLAILKEGVSLETVDAFMESHADQYYSPYRDQPIKYDAEKQELTFVSLDQKSRTNKVHLEPH